MFERLIGEIASRYNLGSASIAALVKGLLQVMTSQRTGGVNGFVDMFRKAGAWDHLSSWLGGKQGKPISASQIETALGIGTVEELAGAAGLNTTTTATVLSALLPRLVSQLTPNGTLPSTSGLISQVSSYLALPAGATAIVDKVTNNNLPKWLPWAALAAIAVVAWLLLRPSPGTIDPTLTVTNVDGRITYSGLVRDERTRTAIADGMRTAFGPANVSGDVRVDANVKPLNWLSRLGEFAGLLKRPGVEFSLSGNAITLGGWLSAAERQALTDRLRAFFGTAATFAAFSDRSVEAVRVANAKAVAALGGIGDAQTSADAVVGAMNLAIINFASGSADIPAEDSEVIRLSAQALARGPAGSRIEVGGHTDNTGEAGANQRLSQARAEAVRNALVAAGADASRLTTAGYGDTKPRASNDTEFGRFQNRRIEYALIK